MIVELKLRDWAALETSVVDDSSDPERHLSEKMTDIQPEEEDEGGGSMTAVVVATRDTWSKKVEFILAVVGFAVDLGNVWRFPYVCYQNGGGAFLIPYCVMLVFGGLPLFFMELALGQFHRSGCLTIWKRICPALKGMKYFQVILLIASAVTSVVAEQCDLLRKGRFCKVDGQWNADEFKDRVNEFLPKVAEKAGLGGNNKVEDIWLKFESPGGVWMETDTFVVVFMNSKNGIGYAICILDIYMGMYYNTIIGWAVYYLVASLRSELPWTSCDNMWNTPNCTPIDEVSLRNFTVSPATEFFKRSVLEEDKSDGLDRMGAIKPSLALCVFAVFLLVYFSLWKGVKSSGKAVWVTALLPYVVLFILLGRGVTLPGASIGIQYYLTPQWHKLATAKVWIDAASQIFFSLGPGFGTLLALSSYNKFHNNCYHDAILTSSINCLTSFLAGFVIFSVLGYMAHVQGTTVDKVGLEGPGLVFIVYPEAIATMTGSVFWAIIFFLMLITLGLDSTFGGMEAMITALCDEYPRLLGRNRELFVLVLLMGVYICALPTCTYGGVYLVDFLNVYGPGLAILFVVFVEAAGVCWIYGVDRFSSDIELMLGYKPGIFWRLCWGYISPIFLLVIFITSLLNYKEMLPGPYVYPDWSIDVGWLLTASSISCIPAYIIYKYIITKGSFLERLHAIMTPEEETDVNHVMGPNYGTAGTHV